MAGGGGGGISWLQVSIIALGKDYGKANAKICSGMAMWVEEG